MVIVLVVTVGVCLCSRVVMLNARAVLMVRRGIWVNVDAAVNPRACPRPVVDQDGVLSPAKTYAPPAPRTKRCADRYSGAKSNYTGREDSGARACKHN